LPSKRARRGRMLRRVPRTVSQGGKRNDFLKKCQRMRGGLKGGFSGRPEGKKKQEIADTKFGGKTNKLRGKDWELEGELHTF